MKTFKFFHRGSEINKIQFSEIEDLLLEKGFNIDDLFEIMADEDENIFVSNGFLRGLNASENEEGEYHHYFKKDKYGSFDAFKLNFKN